jgi:hypothetical protein
VWTDAARTPPRRRIKHLQKTTEESGERQTGGCTDSAAILCVNQILKQKRYREVGKESRLIGVIGFFFLQHDQN